MALLITNCKLTNVIQKHLGILICAAAGIAGYIADGSVSKSRPFLVGIGVMLVATLLFFLSTDPYLIIFARALQGASEALVWVSGVAFLVSQVDEANLGVCMGYTTLGATIGELIGPLLGGYLYEKLGHWAVFGVVELVIAADIVLRLLVKEKDTGSQKQSLLDAVKGTSETDALLGSSVATSHGTLNDAPSADPERGEADDRSALSGTTDCEEDDDAVSALRTLRWNWLSSVIGAATACVVRSALEAVSPLSRCQIETALTIPNRPSPYTFFDILVGLRRLAAASCLPCFSPWWAARG